MPYICASFADVGTTDPDRLAVFATPGNQAALFMLELSMRLTVDCYSGHKGDERPVRFRLDDNEYLVEEILDQWYGPEHVFFKVRAHDNALYILRQQTSVPNGTWELVSYRQTT